jgi:hypothetical protein
MMSTFLRCFVPWTGATLLLVAISAPGPAQEKKYKPFVVTAPDGVTIAVSSFTASRKPRCHGSGRSRAISPRNSA